MRSALPILFFCLVLLADTDTAAVERGKKLFEDTQGLEYPSCAHCHSLLPEKEERKKATHLGPGTTLFGSAYRKGWRNRNTSADIGEASQTCAKKWQQRKGGLKAAQRADLTAYLRTFRPEEGVLEKRKVQRKPKLLKGGYGGGDAAKGKALVLRYCTFCHNDSDDALSFPFRPGKKKTATLVRSVRGYDAKLKFKPKTMSYYTTDRLSDDDLKHIVAYLGR